MIQSLPCFPICDQSQLDRRMGDYFRDNLVHLADGEDFNPKGTSSQCNAFQSDNTMWGDNFICQLGPDLSCGFGYYVLLCQRSYSFQLQNTEGFITILVQIFSWMMLVHPSFHVANPSLLRSAKYSHFACYHPIVIKFYRAGFGGLSPSDTMTRWESQDTLDRLWRLVRGGQQ